VPVYKDNHGKSVEQLQRVILETILDFYVQQYSDLLKCKNECIKRCKNAEYQERINCAYFEIFAFLFKDMQGMLKDFFQM